jgi:hypothetical protein
MDMTSIVPSRRLISDRFPVASFAVNVAPDRLFEVACATHPALLRGDHQQRRTPGNFFTSRYGGLLRAPAGHATYLMPSEQLRRFAGQRRLYYALATYRDQRGSDPEFSVSPSGAKAAPFIQLAQDFSGKTLDRSLSAGRRQVGARYGSAGARPAAASTPAAALVWGGDPYFGAAEAGVAAQPPVGTVAGYDEPSGSYDGAYDDGYSNDLWARGAGAADEMTDPGDPPDPAESRPPGELGLSGDGGAGEVLEEPSGYEDAPALRRAQGAGSDMGSGGSGYGGALLAPNTPPRTPTGRRVPAMPSAPRFGRPATPPLQARQTAIGAPLAATARISQPARVAYGGAPPPATPASPPLRPAAAGRWAGAVASSGSRARIADRRDPDLATARYGGPDALAQTPTAEVPATAPDRQESLDAAVDDDFDELDDETMTSGPAALPEAMALEGQGPSLLSIVDKYKLMLPVARLISGAEAYSAVSADVEFNDPTHASYQRLHVGLGWGLVLLRQRPGALGRCLMACQRRDPARLVDIFGAGTEELLKVTNAATAEERLAPVQGVPLWQEPWVARFRAAGEVPAFRAAQNEAAIEGYLDPNLELAAALGFNTDRALAILFDRCLHMGNGAGRRFVLRAVSPLVAPGDEGRALSALGFPTLQAFQETVGLPATGRLGTHTHAALIRALRQLDQTAPATAPRVAGLHEMLDRLVAASAGRRFARRVAELRRTPELSDADRLLS